MKRASAERPTRPGGQLQLTGEGVVWLGAALLLGAVGWYKSINIVLLLAYVMLALLLLNTFLARAQTRRVTATREAIAPIHANEDASLRLTVRNHGKLPATVTVVDLAGGDPVAWLVYRLPSGDAAPCSTRRAFPTRGLYPATPIRVSSGFPFGLLRFNRAAGLGADVVVLPAVGVADAVGLRRWVMMQTGGDGRARKVLRRVTNDEAEVRGVRPYRPGDAIRSIHWRSSARSGELMVREYDTAPAPDLILVVEPWLPLNPTATDQQNLEAALSLAVTVAQTWGREARVTVAVAGDPASVRTAAGSDSAVREALAPLAGVVGGQEFHALTSAALGRAVARTARVVVSSRRNSPHAAALTRSTGRPFLAMCPADSLTWYTPPPDASPMRG